MHLINTIELSPYGFANQQYSYPNGGSAENPEEWDRFWKKCISDKNLDRLEAIRKGSYLVDISTINDNELEEILKQELKEVDLSDYDEQVCRLDGGIVVAENNTIYIEPTCCGDIGNIAGWEEIFGSELNTWNQLWIGHPWIYYRRDGEFIEFSNYTEPSGNEVPVNFDVLIRLSAFDLQTELKRIREQQNEFESSIQKNLQKMGIANAEQIAKIMTGNA
jgi:hypothetical protein